MVYQSACCVLVFLIYTTHTYLFWKLGEEELSFQVSLLCLLADPFYEIWKLFLLFETS